MRESSGQRAPTHPSKPTWYCLDHVPSSLDSQLEGPSLAVAAKGRSTSAQVPATAATSIPFQCPIS